MPAAPRPRGRETETRDIQDVALRAEWDMEGKGQQASGWGGQDLSLSLLAKGGLHPLGFPLCSWANPSLYVGVPSSLLFYSSLYVTSHLL